MNQSALDQFHPSLEESSAVTSEILTLREIFESMGCASRVFAEEFYPLPGRSAQSWGSYRGGVNDLLMVHYSHGSQLFDQVFEAHVRKVLVYHNITPAHRLRGIDSVLREKSEQAMDALGRYTDRVEAAVAHSEFSARDLRDAGYSNVRVVPFALNERLYDIRPDPGILRRYRDDGWRNLLVVGRILPHKCIEDSLFVLDYLKRFVDPRWRLIVVGSWEGSEVYRERLLSLIASLQLTDVVWAGRAPQASVLAYFRIADALLFMSEHEGFGVPLVEAMRLGVPVLAYAAGSTPEVMGNAGVLFDQKDWPLIAETAALIASDSSALEALLNRQRRRAEFFSREIAEQRWSEWAEQLMGRPAVQKSSTSTPAPSAAEARIP